MILPFSTQLNGKPTFFVEKIQTALRLPYFKNSVGFSPEHVPPDMNFYVKSKCSPKLHTIREDKKERWKPGTKIDFFINCRQKDMFRFAPVVPVVSVQKITVLWYRQDCNAFLEHKYTYKNRNARVYIDGSAIKKEAIEQLSKNDGFDTPEEFFEYFNENFTGKLIHWTDLKY